MNEIPSGKFYPIPFWGPIVVGTLLGCGGMFLPFDKGLKSIENGSPWPLQSSFYAAFTYHILAHDPNFKKYTNLSLSEESARFGVVVGIVLIALLQTFFGDDFNPFRPVHNFMYVVTGIRSGRVNSKKTEVKKNQKKNK
eukprot:CAMPEP_0171460938 /NCGR_PEP_ID=MMETSP0945-20130129/5604_1 /TAXON_ID=109269 /ORGANISM="Vaucheria litorea, Strain CCMP2940" /LENGTH=138 /DNA_ID=CAMNT_0011987221 /DNA_START=404 /DNA_END=820 /DNA_ORIENTATION=-